MSSSLDNIGIFNQQITNLRNTDLALFFETLKKSQNLPN